MPGATEIAYSIVYLKKCVGPEVAPCCNTSISSLIGRSPISIQCMNFQPQKANFVNYRIYSIPTHLNSYINLRKYTLRKAYAHNIERIFYTILAFKRSLKIYISSSQCKAFQTVHPSCSFHLQSRA